MKICVGLRSYDDLERYIEAGANEFFCGTIDEKWVSEYSYLVCLNRRACPSSNLSDFKVLARVVKKAHQHGCKVFYTINEHYYTNSQIKLLDYHIQQALSCEVDAIICSDIGLIRFIYSNYKCNIHVSTGGTVFNRYAVGFYHEAGVKRIILPRQVTIKEIDSISRLNHDLEFEVFMLNEGCINIDGFCNFVHGLRYVSEKGHEQQNEFGVGCMLKYDVVNIKGEIPREFFVDDIEKKLYSAVKQCGTCGVCAVYFFKDMNIHSLKLVGRSTPAKQIENDIKFLKKALALTKEAVSFKEYHSMVSEQWCKRKGDNRIKFCYYPDIIRILENE